MSKAKEVVISYGGDIFKSPAQTIVNPINCVGVMGGGLAAAFRKRYPEMNKQYELDCAKGLVKVKQPYVAITETFFDKCVINFPTKDHYKDPSRLEWVDGGLHHLGRYYKEWGITSIAIPALGAGLGGLRWEDVLILILSHVKNWDIPVYIYPPH